MDFLKRLIFKIILPQVVGLALAIWIIVAFPNLSEDAYMVILLAIISLAQIPMVLEEE